MSTERTVHKLNEKVGITSDGSMNIMLMELYEKQDGKGKGAVKTGEFAWRPLNGGAYFGTLKSVANTLLRTDVVEAVGEVGLDFDKFTAYLDDKLKQYEELMEKNIVLELSKVKEKQDDQPVTTSKVKIKKGDK